MSRLDWDRDKTRHQRWDATKRLATKPIESTVTERPATPKQLQKIRELCDQIGATMPDTTQMTTRGAHWTIKNLQARARTTKGPHG